MDNLVSSVPEIRVTPGNGVARKFGEGYIFIKTPENTFTFEVGDKVPDHWELKEPSFRI